MKKFQQFCIFLRKIKKHLNLFFSIFILFFNLEIQIISIFIDFVANIHAILLELEKLLNIFTWQEQAIDILRRVILDVNFVLNLLKSSYIMSVKVKKALTLFFSRLIVILNLAINFATVVNFFLPMIKKVIKFIKKKFF